METATHIEKRKQKLVTVDMVEDDIFDDSLNIKNYIERSNHTIHNLPIDNKIKSNQLNMFENCQTEHLKSEESLWFNEIRRSPRLSQRNASTCHENKENVLDQTYENNVTAQQVPQLIKFSIRLNYNDSSSPKNTNGVLSSEPCQIKEQLASDDSTAGWIQETDISDTDDLGLSNEMSKSDMSISTRSFYKNSKNVKTISQSNFENMLPIKKKNLSPQTQKTSPRSRHNIIHLINKGVRHKIRKPQKQLNVNGRCGLPPINVNFILSKIRSEKLRKIIESQREEREQIETVHRIFRNARDPIKMARPLSVFSNDSNNNNNVLSSHYSIHNNSRYLEDDFSDCDCEDTESFVPPTDTNLTSSEPDDVLSNRKFFKSGRRSSTPMEVKITENIRASVCNGKISLVQAKPKERKIKPNLNSKFSSEQETVKSILQKLDDSARDDLINSYKKSPTYTECENPKAASNITHHKHFSGELDKRNKNVKDYAEFRKRLPYNTTDTNKIEKQFLLLDFLNSNNICTEENFKIFITEPDNNKDKAARIVDELAVVKDADKKFRLRLPYKTTDPKLIAQQEYFVDFLIKNDICTEENFDIFIANYKQRHEEAAAIMNLRGLAVNDCNVEKESNFDKNFDLEGQIHPIPIPSCSYSKNESRSKLFQIFTQNLQPINRKTSRHFLKVWTGGQGVNQYQIDAGQKAFGASQCMQCGLVYTVHEPEEEQLHHEYHNSIHVLRFKGWIDEDIVAVYPEWESDGRIIRLTECSPSKRLERLIEILKITDKELGFTAHTIPKTFVAYFAVRKNQIVGLCLAHPLDKANRYIRLDGIDYCSEEEYKTKCGILKIWVSPLHRRKGIASKLIRAVQKTAIVGEEIPINLIGFSIPSDDGRLFAQSLTKTENFLVYHKTT